VGASRAEQSGSDSPARLLGNSPRNRTESKPNRNVKNGPGEAESDREEHVPMAQFYTLEEAARVLGMSPEDLKAQAQQRKVRAFLDGGSWRFRAGDVDELARQRGMGSDAELPLSDIDLPLAPEEEPDEIDMSEFQLGVSQPDLGAPTQEVAQGGSSGSLPVAGADSGGEQDILLDDLSLPPNATASSSVIIGMQSTTGRLPSDSDVRLIPDNASGSGLRPSDSDVRLTSGEMPVVKPPGDSDVTLRQPSDSDVTLIAEGTSEHELLRHAKPGKSGKPGKPGKPAGPGDTAVGVTPLSGSSEEVLPAIDSDSDFDLSPSSEAVDALQPDSGSDFELSALEGSDEFEATPLSGPSDSDVTAADPGFSGINLSRPSDSGINLQMASGLGLGGAESIELAPLSGSNIKPVPAPPAKPKPSLAKTPPTPAARKAEKQKEKEKDIFDDTDFEVDALDTDKESDDRTIQLEAQSDFELEDADTGSEVFAIDEEDVDQNAATALGPAAASVADDEDEEEEDTFGPGVDEVTSGWDVESESTPSTPAVAGRAGPSPMLAGAGASPEWGGVWVGLLGVATLFMLFLTFVSVDLVRNLYDFRGDSPASGIVKLLAGLVGG
jgi:hypothetical protein